MRKQNTQLPSVPAVAVQRAGSVRRVELPPRITDKWTRERTDAELRWLATDFQGTCNGQRFDAEIRRRKEALNADISDRRDL